MRYSVTQAGLGRQPRRNVNLDALRLVRSVTVQLAAETSNFPLSAAFGTVTWGERADAKTRVRGINLAAGAGA
jgi:hypothetical protein